MPRVRVRRPSRDVSAAAGAAAVFSCSLGMASVALPLLALDSGYSGAEVGVLIAVSAATQMVTRIGLGLAMRLVGDWLLVVSAAAMLAISNGLLAWSAAVVPFVAAAAVQGVARACFWTGSQTHVVRGPGAAVGALARVNFVSSIGLLAGPVLAGALTERSARLALAVAAAIAVLAMVPSVLLDRLPAFSPPADRPAGRIWRRPGVATGCWVGASAGAWRGLLSSYVPVALDAARQPGTTIGILVSVANASATVGAGIVGRVRGPWVGRSLVVGCLVAGLAMAMFVPLAEVAWAAGVVLCASGIGAGALQTVGPAVATEAVHAEERGEAIAAAGTFRAAALFGAPLAVAGAISLMPLGIAMALVGLVIAVPAGSRTTGRSHAGPRIGRDTPVGAP